MHHKVICHVAIGITPGSFLAVCREDAVEELEGCSRTTTGREKGEGEGKAKSEGDGACVACAASAAGSKRDMNSRFCGVRFWR